MCQETVKITYHGVVKRHIMPERKPVGSVVACLQRGRMLCVRKRVSCIACCSKSGKAGCCWPVENGIYRRLCGCIVIFIPA